jgi:hypothetical protein
MCAETSSSAGLARGVSVAATQTAIPDAKQSWRALDGASAWQRRK